MSRTILGTICAAVLLSACAAPDYISVDARFSAEEESLIREAASNWEIATGARIDLVFGEHVDLNTNTNTSSLVRTTSRAPEVHYSGHSADDGAELDSPLWGNKRIMIVTDAVARDAAGLGVSYADLFRYAVTHEMGHWLGIQYHLESATATMRAGVRNGQTLSVCVTAEDAKAFCDSTKGCRPDQMKGCVP